MVKKLTTKEFVEKAQSVHGGVYDYSKIIYKSSSEKVTITCREHGDFEQRAAGHLKGKGCKRCAVDRNVAATRITQDEFLLRSIAVHGTWYDYSKSAYVSNNIRVIIICPEHGEFTQKPVNHWNKSGCKQCGRKKRSEENKQTQDEFIEKAIQKHGSLYNYGLVNYIDAKTKIKVLCEKHGVFEQTPNNHLRQDGCPQCVKERPSSKKFSYEYVKKTIESVGYKMLSESYAGCDDNISLICKNNHEFETTFYRIKNGMGCSRCAGNHVYSQDEIVSYINNETEFVFASGNYSNSYSPLQVQCPKGHTIIKCYQNIKSGRSCPVCGNKIPYTYRQVKDFVENEVGYKLVTKKSDFINTTQQLELICESDHQTTMLFANIKKGHRCRKCKQYKSQKNLIAIAEKLTGKIFEVDRRDHPALKGLQLDGWNNEINLALEYDGEQHYMPIKFSSSWTDAYAIKCMKGTQKRDRRKDVLCKKAGINLIRLKYDEPKTEEYIRKKLIKNGVKIK